MESAFDNPTYEIGVSAHAILCTLSEDLILFSLGQVPLRVPPSPLTLSLFLGQVDYGPANLIQVSNSQQSLYFAGDERI